MVVQVARCGMLMRTSGISEESALSIFRVDWFPCILFKTHLQPSLQVQTLENPHTAYVLFEVQTYKNRHTKAKNLMLYQQRELRSSYSNVTLCGKSRYGQCSFVFMLRCLSLCFSCHSFLTLSQGNKRKQPPDIFLNLNRQKDGYQFLSPFVSSLVCPKELPPFQTRP